MVKYYVLRIKMGYMTIDQVPLVWRKKVQEEISDGRKIH